MTPAGTPATLRLFVAGDLPEEAKRGISAWQQTSLGSRDEVRVNHALHVTLAFLGSMPAASVSDIAEVLAGVRVREAPVEVGEPAFLPVRGAKRVVVLPLEDQSGALSRLQADVGEALAARGLYEPPGRPWLPHLTVARFRRPGHPFPLQNVNIGGFGVVRMVLYSSLLERAGAVHTPLNVFPAS
jgi:2'-5' RNA ligase